MNPEIEKAKRLMENGWKAREALEFKKSERLLKKARQIFESQDDWFNVTECINHLAYTRKLQATHLLMDGLKLAEESESLAKKHGTKDVLILRVLLSIHSALGNFEKALTYSQQFAANIKKPAPKADALSHLATFELRTGKPEAGLKSIESAFELLEKGWEDEREPHRTIWKVKMLLTKGLILFDLGDLKKAKVLGEKALELATKNDQKTRIGEAKQFLSLFK